MLNLSSDSNLTTSDFNPYLPKATDTRLAADSIDRSAGVGPALPVKLSGQITNIDQGTFYIDSSSSGIASVSLTDGWTGSNLEAQIDSLTWTAKDVLQNGDLNNRHYEQFIVTTDTTQNDDAVYVPDGWTVIKNVIDDNKHPQHGFYELDSDPNGIGGTWGVYLEAQLTTSYDANPNDEIYIGQMVSMPYRELYSAQISFRYRVSSSSTMNDKVHIFVRLAGYTYKYHVFESGDTTDTWLTTSPLTIPASSMTGLSTHTLLFDIGLATDESVTQTSASNAYAYIDDVQLDLTVRPFPEQVDLKANGTIVWGSTTHSVYPYVPDDDGRDCYDDNSDFLDGFNGIDLDGYDGGPIGELDTGIYGSFLAGSLFETGMQFPLDIPQGAIITSAYVEVEAIDSSSPYLLGMRVYVADQDTVQSFSVPYSWANGTHLEDWIKSWVETSIDWSFTSWETSFDTRYRSPEIGPLVQSVISRSGWSTGNYICFMLTHMYSGTSNTRWNGIKGTAGFSGEDRARLFVEYVLPEPEDNILFFEYQKDITIDHTSVVADLTDFPVLIDLVDSDLKDHVQANGNDIIFTIDGTPLAHEIELFDQDYSPTEAHLVAWVKVPLLSSSIDTVITMAYGNPEAELVGRATVWDDYVGVWHLDESPTGPVYDSSQYNNHGTTLGSMSSSDLVTGHIGSGFDLDGIDDMINVLESPSLDSVKSGGTISLWINWLDSSDGGYQRILTTSDRFALNPTPPPTLLQTDGFEFAVQPDGDNFFYPWGGSGSDYNLATNPFTNSIWQHLVVTLDYSTKSVVIYLDGAPLVLTIENVPAQWTQLASLGTWLWGGHQLDAASRFLGMFDEIRVSNAILSPEWIETEYNNQDNTAAFYSVGAEETIPDTWVEAGETQVVFTTSSAGIVTLNVNLVMDIGGIVETMDENFDNGVSYFIKSGSNIVNWTAKVMVSPPAGATSLGFSVEYPRAEWKATKVLNPLDKPKALGSDWWYQGGTLTLNPASIDFWGVWTLKFISWNFLQDLQINNTAFDIDEAAKFTITTPTIYGARAGLDLLKPNGDTWYSSFNQTSASTAHKFPSFRYRKVITIPSSQIYGTVVNFPVLVQFTDTDLHNPSKVRSDASDILFASGDTILDHEIENFQQNYPVNTALLVAWVKTNLTAGVDNYITMYYGSPVVDNLENPSGVWSNDFEAVWHLGESVISGPTHYDSSGNNYNGVRNGNEQTAQLARAGYGQTFDGIGDYISIDETLTPNNDVLISGWFRLSSSHSSTSPNTRVIMEKYADMTHNMAIALAGTNYGGSVAPGSLVFKVESSSEGAAYTWTSTITSWAANVWFFIACYVDEDAPENNAIWVNNGWASTDQLLSTTYVNVSYVEEWRLGGGEYDSGIYGTGYFPGSLDEFRVSNTFRDFEWLRTEAQNQLNTGTFLSRGTEQQRASTDHTLETQFDSTAPAGQWTAVAYYNDTGNSVSNKTGLFERTFIVRHPTTLTLNEPLDAVGDRLSVKTAGDSLIIEYELTDDITTQGVTGATVKMNWTTPSTITLNDYGGGLYGKVLSTTSLGDNKQWHINVWSYHQYYNNATEYFDIDLYHSTRLQASGITTTPADFNFTATLIFRDQYTSAPIQGATITYDDGSPVEYVTDNGDGTYDIAIPTNSLSLGNHQYVFNATKSGAYLHEAQVDVTFTLRAHRTAVTVTGDMTTPYGNDTQVNVFLFDLDTESEVGISDVSTLTFSYTGGYLSDVFGTYSATLTTADWNVGSVTATLNIVMSNIKIQAPTPYLFTIQILAHKTSLTVTGAITKPYGNQTELTIVLTDLETGLPVPIGSVSNIQLQHNFGTDNFGSYAIILDTSTWDVGSWTVTVNVAMSGTIYSAPSSYQFTVTIRSMISTLYTGPSAFNFTIGSDFVVDLHLNISEAGQYYGNPIIGRAAGEFSVPGYTISLDTSQNAVGLYKLTIDWGQLSPGGSYEITVYFTSWDSEYSNAHLIIQFSYRPIVSYLSSPNYPQVTTPYQLDVEIILEYADADFGTGIEGATITSPDHQAWIANSTDETGGVYSVWIDVSTLAKGTHYISLTAYKSGYDAKTLQFRIVIRDAYTSVTPSVGSLDIPIGNSVVFTVDYTDLDRILPIDNLTSPYTQVISTWGNFSVVYVPLNQEYRITFRTSDSDTIAQNQVYTFTFLKENYQTVQFSITVTIRTHNTDFRIVSSIEPTSTIGTFNISVYYGDLDNAVGIKSALVIFSVSNLSGPVISSYDYDLVLGDGFYIIQVPAWQFGLGLQTFTVYADWTGVVAKYKDKSFVTSANVVGRESALTLLLGSEPTPYNEDMGYIFFYSDLFSGIGIDNLTGNVFIYVSFQDQTVDPSDIIIADFSSTEAGKYSVEFNTSIFSRTGIIYMNVFVNWSKGVSPFYSNRTDVISIRVLPRNTLLSITPAPSTSYNEDAEFTLRFEDITSGMLINDDPKLTISMNVSFSYVESGGTFTITVDTGQFGSLGIKAILIDVTWSGSPFYANRTGRITYISVKERITTLEYLTPPPTQYGDLVIFNVTWTDTTEGASIPITAATLVLKEGATPIDSGKYTYVEISPGIYQVTLNTTYAMGPGTDTLRVEMSIGVFYYVVPKFLDRLFTVLERATIVAANPVANVPFGSPIIIVVSYVDLFTSVPIANDAAHGYPVTVEVLGQTFTSTWRPVEQNYLLNISWNPSWDATWLPGTSHTFTIQMSYAPQAPFYAQKETQVTFKVRSRLSSLALITEPETTPYLDNVIFTVYFSDEDANGLGIAGAVILISGFTEFSDYVVSEGSPGYYEVTFFTTSVANPGTHVLNIQADWTGAPYHNDASRDVSVLVRTRATNLEVTVPPSQTLFLDDVSFEFEFNDLDAGTSISLADLTIIHLYWPNMTEINQLDYSIIETSGTYELTISSIVLTTIPVTGLSIRVAVDWPVAQDPFYGDDYTIVKITITGRSILVETDQIERTPKGDVLDITINLSDLDTGNPIEGAIILFSCQGHFLQEGIDYTTSEGLGIYVFNVDTLSLIGTGTFLFDIEVQWNPSLPPFYSNRSVVTLTGLVDLVRTSLQVNALVPSSVQYTGTVSLNVTWSDLDHVLPVTGYSAILASNIKYLVSGTTPASLVVYEYGSSGIYNISFSTSDLTTLGPYTLRIVAAVSVYASVTVTPQFNVIAINTVLTPDETSVTVDWKSGADVWVEYRDLLNDVSISSALSVIWEYKVSGITIDSGPLVEFGSTGRYTTIIDTTGFGAGTYVITVTAMKDKYTVALTTITLVVMTLPSEIILYDPTETVTPVNRGDPVYIEIELWDITDSISIDSTQVRNASGYLQVYAMLEGLKYYMSYDVFSGRWDVTIPGNATILEALLSYDIQIFASFRNYDPAVNQFKIYIRQTATQLKVIGIPDPTKLEVYYLQNVTLQLNFTANAISMLIDDANVSWIDSTRDIYLNFTSIGGGIWTLTFNTSILGFGTVGVSFYGYPTNTTLANTLTSMTLTIKKIPTSIEGPTEIIELDWGWTGYISLNFSDDYNSRYVSGALVTYNYGNLDFNATDLGNGTYSLFIDTTILDSNVRERITTAFFLLNYEERSFSFYIRVEERPTELIVDFPDQNFISFEQGIYYLQLPMGDTIDISLLYNDISTVGGLFGGITNANFTDYTEMRANDYFIGTMPIVFQQGFGYYNFTFDTSNASLYDRHTGPIIIEGKYFQFEIGIFDDHRQLQVVYFNIKLIQTPTEILHEGEVIDTELVYTMINGETLTFDFYLNDTWHGWGVAGASFTIESGTTAIISSNSSLGNGYYRIVIRAVGYGDFSSIRIVMSLAFHEDAIINFEIRPQANDFDKLLINITFYGLPISIFIIVLLGAYVKIWSVPKRIRQINGQLKSLKKGKVPKPVSGVKSRQQLTAELFNDTFEELKITRTAAQMPEEAIPIEVPEMGELLMQLAILTHLSAEELDEFQADIKKMKMSEQAAFVKEVIMQEAIRSARREGKTIEETLANIQQEALRRLGGEEKEEPVEAIEPEDEERVFLEEEEKDEVVHKEIITPEHEKPVDETPEIEQDKMTLYEIEELRRDLEQKGVPPHEIETIIEQAKALPRDLVDELVKSLEGKKE